MSNLPSQPQYAENPSLETVKKICGIPARLTGFLSLIVQTIVLLIALALTILMFYQLGGYKFLTSSLSNRTDDETNKIFPTPTMLEIKNILLNGTDTIDASMDWDNETIVEHASNSSNKLTTNGTLLQQIGPIYLRIGKLELDVLSLLRCSCLLYIGLCAFWLISLICLGLSLRFEVLDLVYVNTFILTIALVYTLIQALLVGIIIFYQEKFNWPILLLICGIVAGYLICFIFEILTLILLVVWYRYIDYINGNNETCLCTSTISQFIKNRRRQNRGREAAAADYTIPEATRHANLPYIDEPNVQQFSNF